MTIVLNKKCDTLFTEKEELNNMLNNRKEKYFFYSEILIA